MTVDRERQSVVLVIGHDRRALVRSALSSLGESFREFIAKAKRIFIHPNLVSWHRPVACTDVEAVRGVVDHMALIRGDEIPVGDAGYRDTKRAFEALGYPTLARSGNVRLVDLNDDETVPAWAYTADFEKRPIGFSKTVAESDCRIVVVPAKMHSYYTVSLSVKTHIVGSLVVPRSPFDIHARWPWLHTGYKPAHLTLAELYAEHPAGLAIIDGTRAMEGNGPTSGEEVNLGWLIASWNPVAADALAAWLMGLEPRDIGYLAHLERMGFGPIDPAGMNILGPDAQALRRELRRPDTYPDILAA